MNKVNIWEKEKKEIRKGDICPICKYGFSACQCRFGGSAHPDRTLNRKVVLDHLYLLSKKQLKHIIKLEKDYCISSSDEKYNLILDELTRQTRI
jgi:hypothetical protein